MSIKKIYKRKTNKEREQLFNALAMKLGHKVVNVKPPKDKNKIKEARKSSHLSGSEAAIICGVSRRSWTMWENHKDLNDKKTKETYPSDWQWGWFLLATNQHPTLQLIRKINKEI